MLAEITGEYTDGVTERAASHEHLHMNDYYTNKGYINPPTCPHKYIEIDSKIHERDRGSIFDQAHTIVPDELVGEPCHNCGVIYDKVHHVGCKSESCPVDPYDGQFLGCGHDEAKYHKRPNDSGKYHPGLYKQLQLDRE